MAAYVELPLSISENSTPLLSRKGIMFVRQGKLKIVPGYDGVYGRISIFPKEGEAEKPPEGKEQMSLF